jgi:putative nucleotidyltransferase with HDIG domain
MRFIIGGVLCYIAIILCLVFLLFPKTTFKFKLDDVALKDYIAPHDINFNNSVRTDALKKHARDTVKPIYVQGSSDTVANPQYLNQFLISLKAAEYSRNPELDYFMIFASSEYWEKLNQAGFTEADLYLLLKLDKKSLDSFSSTLLEFYKKFTVENVQNADPSIIGQQIKQNLLRAFDENPELAGPAGKVLQAFLSSGKQVDEKATEIARKQAEDLVAPVMETIRKDEIFLRKGEKLSQRHLNILNSLYEPESRKEARVRIRKITVMSCLVIAGFAIFFYFMGLMSRNPLADTRLYYLFLVQVLVTILLGIVIVKLFPGDGLPYLLLIPLVTHAWIITYFISVEASILSTLFLGAFFAMVFNLTQNYMLTSVLTGSIASFLIKRDCRREDIIRGSLALIIIGAFTIIAVNILLESETRRIFAYLQYNFYACIIAPFLMLGLSTIIYVQIFNVVTRYHLIDLSDVNHSLIRQLQRKAPGSYHHSLIVGDIAEIAAESINANSLLVRVSCLYHDIGKIKMPQFYIENQARGVNPHDRYPPSLSRLVVLSHVKDGIQMAKKARLPKEIIDAIQQHQGTTLMKYFFRKALAQSNGEPVDEFDYRYEGPVPQNPETAIIALADSVEGAVRSLDEPNPHRIEATVNAIFEDRLLDGQFNECGLSISQLQTVKESLIDTLSGIYHSRIEYPDVKELRSQLEKKKSQEIESQSKSQTVTDDLKKQSSKDESDG